MGSIIRAVHNIGLAVWWGGTVMGTLALNPAVEVLDDPEERGKMVDEGWARFQPYGAAGLATAVVTHVALRRRPPAVVSCRYKNVARLQDLLMLGAFVSSIASMALGEYVTHQDFDAPPSDEGGDDFAEGAGQITLASWVQLLSGIGLFLTGAILSKEREKIAN